jgi:DnaJ-class molecular chaperone
METSTPVDPYEVLGLPRGSGEEEVRRRYLELVRQFPPDRAPERFAEIRGAYEKLRDPVVRVESRLFAPQSGGSMTALAADVVRRLQTARLSVRTLLSLAER